MKLLASLTLVALLAAPALCKKDKDKDKDKAAKPSAVPYTHTNPCIDQCDKYGKGDLRYVNTCFECLGKATYDIKRCANACAQRFNDPDNGYDCDLCKLEGPGAGPKAINHNNNEERNFVDCSRQKPGVQFEACIQGKRQIDPIPVPEVDEPEIEPEDIVDIERKN
jgi:hypothetical protein